MEQLLKGGGGEVHNFVLVWTAIFASLSYCHAISKLLTTNSISRFLSILPVNLLFLVLPLSLSSMLLGVSTCFLISWMANFKLLLFALNKGPLFSDPTLPLSKFILIACLPIKVRHANASSKDSLHKCPSLMYSILIRITLLPILISTLPYQSYIHPEIRLVILGLRIAMTVELILAISTAIARPFLSPLVEVQEPFDNFSLSTSVQNYWGKRWNLVVSDVLKSTIYQPVRTLSAHYLTTKWVSIPGVLATFTVSGLMHELMLYVFERVMPSGYMMAYFLLHGVAVSVEIVLKKKFGRKIKVPEVVSWQLTMMFMPIGGSLLFTKPMVQTKSDLRTCNEVMAFFQFLFTGRLVDPSGLRCPIL